MKRMTSVFLLALFPVIVQAGWWSVGLDADPFINGASIRFVSSSGFGLQAIGNIYYPLKGNPSWIYGLRAAKFFFPESRTRPYIGTCIIGGKDWNISYISGTKFLGWAALVGVEAVLIQAAPITKPGKSPRWISVGFETVYGIVPSEYAGLVAGVNVHYNW